MVVPVNQFYSSQGANYSIGKDRRELKAGLAPGNAAQSESDSSECGVRLTRTGRKAIRTNLNLRIFRGARLENKTHRKTRGLSFLS